MPNESPLLTVAIPTYNCAHFIGDAIGSVLRQHIDDMEILVIDNASEDNTEEVVRSFDDKRIRYMRNEKNVGSRENANRCLVNARGDYIKVFCSDDVMLDGLLRKQLDVLESRPEVALVTCATQFTDENLKPTSISHNFPGYCSGAKIINCCLSNFGNFIGGPSNTMFRRAQVNGITFDNSYFWVADLKFFLQILQRGSYYNIDEIGYLYRRHGQTDTEVSCPEQIRGPECIRVLDEFDAWNPLSCERAIRDGGKLGWQAVRRHWREALTPRKFLDAFAAYRDVLHERTAFKALGQKTLHSPAVTGEHGEPNAC